MRIFTSFFLLLLMQIVAGRYTPLQAQDITISPQPLYFGLTPADRDSYREMVVRNLSAETLNISQISIQGTNANEFSIVENPGSLLLSAFGSSTLNVNFHPQSVGDKQAQITFVSNASSSPDNLNLQGAGSSVSGGKITFEKILGTLEDDGASDVKPTADGGFIIAGNTYNEDQDANDGFLLKTNPYGEIEWTEVFDSDDNDNNSNGFSSVIPVSDGYIVVGTTDNGAQDLDIWVIKTNFSGITQWEKLFGRDDNDAASVIEETNDGNYIIAGFTRDALGVTGNDGYIIKIDGAGTELWSEIIGGSDGEKFSDIKPTDDGGYIMCGSISTGSVGTDMLLVKTNSVGVVSWDEHYGNAGDMNIEQANSLVVAPDGGFILAGWTTDPSISAGSKDIYVIKTDSNGVKDATWGDKSYGEEHQDGASEIISTSDNGFLIVGSIENLFDIPTNDWYSDAYIIKLDQNGSIEWDNVYGGVRGEGVSTVRQLSDGSFILCGSTNSYTTTNDIYLLRINNNGDIPTALKDNIFSIPDKMYLAQNYPNPFNNSTMIKYQIAINSSVNLSIYNLLGQKVATLVNKNQIAGSYQVPWNASGFPSGVYVYKLTMDSGYEIAKKLVLLK